MANLDKAQIKEDTTNPSVNPETGEVNPSAPTTGTEGWGMTDDERAALSPNHPDATRRGQMKGNPGDDRTTSTQKMGGGTSGDIGKTEDDKSKK